MTLHLMCVGWVGGGGIRVSAIFLSIVEVAHFILVDDGPLVAEGNSVYRSEVTRPF